MWCLKAEKKLRRVKLFLSAVCDYDSQRIFCHLASREGVGEEEELQEQKRGKVRRKDSVFPPSLQYFLCYMKHRNL